MEKKLPRIKKEICSFLSDEDGRIFRKSVLAISSLVGGVALSGLFSDLVPPVRADGPYGVVWQCNHTNAISAAYDDRFCKIVATHNFHANLFTAGWQHMIAGCTHTNNCPSVPSPC